MIGNLEEPPSMEDVTEHPLKIERSSTEAEETTSAIEVPSGSSTNSEGTLSVKENNDAPTIHTSQENAIQEMPITKRCLNSSDHQIKVTFVLHSPVRPKIEQKLTNKKRFYAQVSEST